MRIPLASQAAREAGAKDREAAALKLKARGLEERLEMGPSASEGATLIRLRQEVADRGGALVARASYISDALVASWNHGQGIITPVILRLSAAATQWLSEHSHDLFSSLGALLPHLLPGTLGGARAQELSTCAEALVSQLAEAALHHAGGKAAVFCTNIANVFAAWPPSDRSLSAALRALGGASGVSPLLVFCSAAWWLWQALRSVSTSRTIYFSLVGLGASVRWR